MSVFRKSYFPHDENSRNDQKLLKVRTKFNNAWGYGLFWMLLEAMSESSNGKLDAELYAELELSFGIASSKIAEFIEYCVSIDLFQRDENGSVYTNRMLEHKEFRKERSESGKKGVTIREEKRKHAEHDAEHSVSFMQVKESKVKKVNTTFRAPTPLEVSEYCRHKGYTIDATYFCDYYEARGWMIGKNKIKDWKACIRTWVKRNESQKSDVKEPNWVN